MQTFVLALLCGYLGLITAYPWEPVPRPDEWWVERHAKFLENNKANASQITAVFLGSSSVENWGSTGSSIWNEKYAPLGAVNYGLGGDKIEHCLWRVLNGTLDGLNPKLVVLYCGTNNMPDSSTPLEISIGITTTINEIRKRLPNTNIMYMNLNPRGDVSPILENFERTDLINKEMMSLHNGKDKIRVFDMFNDLIIEWGVINMDYYTGDKLHLNLNGYTLWDQKMDSLFYEGMNGDY